MILTFGIYARKSPDEKQKGIDPDATSIDRQVKRGIAFGESQTWRLNPDCIFTDEFITGAEFERRDGLMALLAAVKVKPLPFQILIVSEKSRLGREQLETGYVMKKLLQAGVRVFFYLSEKEAKITDPIEKMIMAAEDFASEMESDMARKRVIDTMTLRAEKGYCTGGRIFGYENVPIEVNGKRSHVEYRIEKREAAIVVRIFERAAAGAGLRRIARELNTEAIATPRRRNHKARPGWTVSGIAAVLNRRMYTGIVIYNRSRQKDDWKQECFIRRPESEWIETPAPHLRIVSDPLWRRVREHQDRRARVLNVYKLRGRRGGARDGNSKFLLVNFARCAVCGGPMAVSPAGRRGKGLFYTCGHRRRHGREVCTNAAAVPVPEVERAVLAGLLEEVITPEVLEEILDRAMKGRRPAQNHAATVARLERERRAVDKAIANLGAAIAEGGRLGGLLEELKRREARRAELIGALELAQAPAAAGPALDRRRLSVKLRRNVESWRMALGESIGKVRELLRQLLVEPLRCTPEAGARHSLEVSGHLDLLPIFRAIVGDSVAVPLIASRPGNAQLYRRRFTVIAHAAA